MWRRIGMVSVATESHNMNMIGVMESMRYWVFMDVGPLAKGTDETKVK